MRHVRHGRPDGRIVDFSGRSELLGVELLKRGQRGFDRDVRTWWRGQWWRGRRAPHGIWLLCG